MGTAESDSNAKYIRGKVVRSWCNIDRMVGGRNKSSRISALGLWQLSTFICYVKAQMSVYCGVV